MARVAVTKTIDAEIGVAVRCVPFEVMRQARLLSKIDKLESDAALFDSPVMFELLAGTVVIRDGKEIPLTTDEDVNLAFDGRLDLLTATLDIARDVNFADFRERRQRAIELAAKEAAQKAAQKKAPSSHK